MYLTLQDSPERTQIQIGDQMTFWRNKGYISIYRPRPGRDGGVIRFHLANESNGDDKLLVGNNNEWLAIANLLADQLNLKLEQINRTADRTVYEFVNLS